jgi:polyphosphate glucokinase
MNILGIDIGGTGIKGALVNTRTGELCTDRLRLLTPVPATPAAVAETVAQLVAHFNWQGPIGCGFPAAIRDGVALTAANISQQWIGCNVRDLLQQATGCAVTVLNDADAAGYAEMDFGAGKDHTGTVLLCTFGTGIGSALFSNGQLVPNTEFGHIEIKGKKAERWASGLVREKQALSWKHWAKRLNVYLAYMQAYVWPDLIIVGGGVSKKHDRFLPLLELSSEIVPAQMRNEAGIIGAALAAMHAQPKVKGKRKASQAPSPSERHRSGSTTPGAHLPA